MLCSVGFTEKPLLANEPERPTETQQGYSKGKHDNDTVDAVRVRESELDPALFDPVTGEFFTRPQQPKRGNRAAADAWVIEAVSQKVLASDRPP